MSTKIHVASDGLGLPVRLIGTPGQHNDIASAHALVEGFEVGAIIADKGYDADHFVGATVDAVTEVVIPCRSHGKTCRSHDEHLYRERNAVERFFCKLK